MTTIAYRDGILAADGRTSSGSAIFTDNTKKIIRLSDGALFAICGETAYTGPMLEALEDDLPFPDKSDAFTAIIVETNGKLRFYEGMGGFQSVEAPFIAFGSGADFAMGAMEMGASAEEAVNVAIRRDMNSGGSVQIERPGYAEPKEYNGPL